MELLPGHHREFGQKDYWESFFKKRGSKAFEWYGEYTELCGVFHKYIKPTDSILVVGCGNSELSGDLVRTGGFKSVFSIDTSSHAIKAMSDKYAQFSEDLKFIEMDATEMKFPDEHFGVVVDKGTLDALFVDGEDPAVLSTITNMINEIDRTLKNNGRYICISLLQPHILKWIVPTFAERGWPIRIIRCREVDSNKSPEECVFPVFAFIATKFKKISVPNKKIIFPSVLELALSTDGKLTRLKEPKELIDSVRGVQQFAAIRARKRDAADVSLDLRVPGSEAPRYSIFVVDRSQDKKGISSKKVKFAVFVVPEGRESEWLFVTEEGRRQLAESAGCLRMIVVHLHREHTYSSIDAIQDELSSYALEFAPDDLPSNYQIPFMSWGDDNIGKRVERSRGKSKLSGEFVVEDVSLDDGLDYRRLIFLSSPNLTQSEAKLIYKGNGKKKKQVIDHSFLACAHHSVMISSLDAYSKEKCTCLIVGLGGGALASHVSNSFSKLKVDVVELDPAISRVAQDHFEFRENERLKVINDDGIHYINGLSPSVYDVIMLDVDNKDRALGMSCPPKPFIEIDFMNNIKKSLRDNGMLVLNLVCRDPLLREAAIKDLQSVFKKVRSYKIPEEVNEILYCQDNCTTILVDDPKLLITLV
uniref:Methyltransferase like 13 [Latimeria chalumnae] n=1 Tax=Lepeophtheirus salmonis TaxID=72036 RepID=A0A0K2TBZ8_LEPSM